MKLHDTAILNTNATEINLLTVGMMDTLPAEEASEGFTVRMIGWPPRGEAKWICGSDKALLTDGKDGTLCRCC